MKYTREETVNAIIVLAEVVNQKKGFSILAKSKVGLERTIEMIIYQLFINKFDYRSCIDEQYHAYRILWEFASELKEKGFVEFK